MNNLELCRSGNPTERLIGCYYLVSISYYVYAEKGYEEFYDVAVKTANYYRKENPGNQAKFDEFLSLEIKQTSPSSAK